MSYMYYRAVHGGSQTVVLLLCALTEKGQQDFRFSDVLDALYFTTTVAGLLKMDFQMVLEVFLINHVLNVIQEDGSLRTATKGLK